MKKTCKNVSSRPIGLNCRFCWNNSACLPYTDGCLPLLATTTQLFYQSLSSHTACSCLEILSTTNNLCNFWRSTFQPVSTHAFWSWDDISTKKGNQGSPNNLSKCTEPPPTFSTNTSTEWNLNLSWSSHLVTSFRLEMKVGGFSKHQDKTSGTNRYNRYFFTSRVSRVNVITMKWFFEQWCELEVAKCPIVHVLSSSYKVSSFELWNERKATQQGGPRVANNIVLNQIRVYHDRAYADKVESELRFVRSVSS